MKQLILAALLLTGCATTSQLTPLQQCRKQICPRAAAVEEVGPGGTATYDEIDDTCLCTFSNGQIYTTPRR